LLLARVDDRHDASAAHPAPAGIGNRFKGMAGVFQFHLVFRIFRFREISNSMAGDFPSINALDLRFFSFDSDPGSNKGADIDREENR
jgi:hypothetical protein